MPREQITPTKITEYWEVPESKETSAHTARRELDRGAPYAEDHWIEYDPELHIEWRNDAWVQVHLDIDKHQLLRRADEIRESGDLTGSVTFTTDTLTRPEVQNILRTTRRARNAVYGGDE